MQNESVCIICFGENNLKKNDLCYNKCNFFYHEKCYTHWQKTQNQSESTCIVCKDPILNFITGEVSLINPLVRHNDIEFNNNTNVTENQENNTRETNDVCIKQTLIVLLVSMLVLITLTFILALM